MFFQVFKKPSFILNIENILQQIKKGVKILEYIAKVPV